MRALDLVGVVHVDQQREMEIAVADMADDRRQRCRLSAMSRCVSVTHSASREIGTQTSVATIVRAGRSAKFDNAASWRASHSRVRSSGRVAQSNGPPPNSAAISPKRFGLLGHRRLGAVEFEKQHRRFRQAELGMQVARLAPARRRAIRCAPPECRTGWSGWRRCSTASTDGKRTDAAGDGFRNAGQLERQFGDDAERAFRADHQPREVVAGGGFLGAPRGVITSPFASTTFSASTLSFMVP